MRRPLIHPTKGRSGFTLIELLIVVVIIGILATIAAQQSRTITRRAAYATLEADLKVLATHQEMYHHMNLRYADLVELTDFATSAGVTATINWRDVSGFAVTATHAALPAGTECGYFIGAAPVGSAGPATNEGHIVCN